MLRARCIDPYHCGNKGNDLDWDRVKVFMKGNPDVVLSLEPHVIDNFLDNGVSKWITWVPANIEIL